MHWKMYNVEKQIKWGVGLFPQLAKYCLIYFILNRKYFMYKQPFTVKAFYMQSSFIKICIQEVSEEQFLYILFKDRGSDQKEIY